MCAAALAPVLTIEAAEPQSCEHVRMAAPGWADIDTTNAISGIVLKALGYQQTVASLSVPITYEGLKKGQIDVFLGNWMPAQAPLVKPFVDSHSIEILHANLSNAKFTLAVPDYVAAAGVHTFADLAKNADKFDDTIYGIEAGAPANQNIRKMIGDKAFGLGDWKIVQSSETAMLNQVARAVREKKWIVFLAWEPHEMNTRFRITYLAGGDAYFGPNYGGATVNTVSRTGFAEQCTNLARLFRQMTFNVDLENQIMTNVLRDKEDVNTASMNALKAHSDLLGPWLAGVTTVGGANGLQAVNAAIGVH
jgi:glycine betaine/proline transport system substrate-binding protein